MEAYYWLKFLAVFIIGLFLNNFLSSYMSSKGKNLATSEDIENITRKTEEVKEMFQTSLENHKHELSQKLEVIKHGQSKLFKEFELYTIKKHEHYPEFYKLIELCNGSVRRLRGFREIIDFTNVNDVDVRAYMTDKNFTDADKQIIVSRWNTEKEEAIDNLTFRLNHIEYNEARESYNQAHNFYLLNLLYFSDNINHIGKELLEKIFDLWQNYSPNEIITNDPHYIRHLNEQNKELIEQIDVLKMKLFTQMKKELLAEE